MISDNSVNSSFSADADAKPGSRSGFAGGSLQPAKLGDIENTDSLDNSALSCLQQSPSLLLLLGSSTQLDNTWQLLVNIFSTACGADGLIISISWWDRWIQRSGPRKIPLLLSVKPTQRQNPECIIPIKKYHMWIRWPVGYNIFLCTTALELHITADILTYHSKRSTGIAIMITTSQFKCLSKS